MASSVIILVACLHVWLGSVVVEGLDVRKSSKCERITIPMCQDMPYNLTRMPNLMGHKDQSEAAIQVHEFIPLVEIGCSKNLKFFLCSLYAPMCTEQIDIPIPSCQSICEEVKSRCLPVLRQFNFNWPPMLNCSRLPVPKDGLCMEVPNVTESKNHKQHVSTSFSSQPSSASSSSPPKQLDIQPNRDRELTEKEKEEMLAKAMERLYPTHKRRQGSNSQPAYDPSKPSINLNDFEFSYHLNAIDNGYGNGKPSTSGTKIASKCYAEFVYIPIAGKQPNQTGVCAFKCAKDILFTRADKNFVEILFCILASICFMSTLFTVLTFWIDTQRFRYPEKPIIFLSMCSCISSVAYLIRIYAGPEFVSCDRTDSGEDHITLEGLDNSGCIIVFLLMYYFGMAATMWWVCLTITWYLAAAKKWSHEAIEAKASIFHLMSWATPAILTIIVLTLRHVDGDELTGLCYVGNHDPHALLYFVIIPLSVLSSLTVLTLICGSVSLARVRPERRYDGSHHNSHQKSDRLLFRIGVFSSLYALPALSVIACHVYEYMDSDGWRETALDRSRTCHDTNAMTACRLDSSIPHIEVFVLKIFMSLVLGISTGIWVWTNRTWSSWTQFCQSTFGKRQRRTFKCPQVAHNSQYTAVQQQQTPSSSVTSATVATAVPVNGPHNHALRQQSYHHSYASIKSSQRHSHRPHRKQRTNNSITHV